MLKNFFLTIGFIALLYWLLAYQILPRFWRDLEPDPRFNSEPKITHTKEGIPGDPINVVLAGTQEELVQAMHKAGWFPANALTFKTAAKIVKSALFKKPYPKAPVSNLYFFGRKEDLTFEQPAAENIKKRHHVRFWQSDTRWKETKPVWLGAATFDTSYGFSRYTGQILHHIDADIDAERGKLFSDLENANEILLRYQASGIGPTLSGRNGEGDRYYTDGMIDVGILR